MYEDDYDIYDDEPVELADIADAIEEAERAGGVTLELYRRPGFEAGMGVRHRYPAVNVAGVPNDGSLDRAYEDDPGTRKSDGPRI